MDKEQALQYLHKYLIEIPKLKDLHYSSPEFMVWKVKTQNLIKEGFDPVDSSAFSASFVPLKWNANGWPEETYQQNYIDNLSSCEKAIKFIIKKHELVGTKLKYTIPGVSTTEIPNTLADQQPIIHLFDKMQFHPRVVEASRSLFESKHYAQAIFEAFKAVNIFVKEKSNLDLDGKVLMAEAFSEKNPVIKLNGLQTQTDRNEQEGFKFLFMGAMLGIRNPKAHENIVQTDPFRTLEYLAFASLLLRRVEDEGWSTEENV